MNRQQRRAEAAKARRAGTTFDRADAIRLAVACLAAAGPTATGATLFCGDGSVTFLDAADARVMHGAAPARGHA